LGSISDIFLSHKNNILIKEKHQKLIELIQSQVPKIVINEHSNLRQISNTIKQQTDVRIKENLMGHLSEFCCLLVHTSFMCKHKEFDISAINFPILDKKLDSKKDKFQDFGNNTGPDSPSSKADNHRGSLLESEVEKRDSPPNVVKSLLTSVCCSRRR
jgi:hypothetical protein